MSSRVPAGASVRRSSEERRFEPIVQMRAHEYVAEQIRRHIALRLIGPGDALPSERDLAATFGVGRPTIQHALRLLEAEGLVEARRGRNGGTFVSSKYSEGEMSQELLIRISRRGSEIEELLTFRRAIEPATAAIAARTRTEEDLRALEFTIEGMTRAASEDDYMRYDTEYHVAIARSTRNRHLIRAAEDIRLGLNDPMLLLPDSPVWHRRIDEQHANILQTITANDPRGAEEAMRIHVVDSEHSLRAVLSAVARRTGLEW